MRAFLFAGKEPLFCATSDSLDKNHGKAQDGGFLLLQYKERQMKQIPLTQGKVALVDDADYEWLNQWKWSYLQSRREGKGYAIRSEAVGSGKDRMIYMHRAIMSPREGQRVDHRDGNGTNNRRRNLRLATQSQNLGNTDKRKTNKSGYKGVSWDRQMGKWVAHITKQYRCIHLGYFANKEEAARAYNVAARKYHGEFARLNNV